MKAKHFILLALALVVSAPSAFALNCVSSQAIDKSDACETSVRVASDETTLVSEGMVLVYDLSGSTNNLIASNAELGDASAEGVYAAGIVKQSGITSGGIANVVTRGKTKVLVTGSVAAGDALYVTTTEGKLGNIGTAGQQVGWAIEAGIDTEVDAYITIV